jgi:hypothetical protein
VDSIQIKYLNQIETISAVKVLISFCHKVVKDRLFIVEYAIADIAEDSKVSENTTRRAIKELVDLKFIEVISTGRGHATARYKVLIEVPFPRPAEVEPQKIEGHKIEPPKVEPLKWEKAVAVRKNEHKQEDNIINNINNIDLININLLREDINSLSVVNSNIYMNDKELGQIANRVMREVFLPNAIGSKPSYWFPQQMKLMKDLLVQWRTEQVVAAIRYWTKINPPPTGVSSLRFLMFKRKNTSNLMHALDYWKQEYINTVAHEDAEAKAAEAISRAEEAEKKMMQEAEQVANMSDADFLANLFGGIKRG